MKLGDLLRLDLGVLLLGRVRMADATPWQASRKGKTTLPPGWLPWKRRFRLVRGPDTKSELLVVTRQLKQLISCGAPLAEGLRVASVDCPLFQVYAHLNRLADALEAGADLTDAMKREPDFFPRYYVDIVYAAERSAGLPEALGELEEQIGNDLRMTIHYAHRIWYVINPFVLVFVAGGLLQTVFAPLYKEVLEDVGVDASRYPQLRFGRFFMEFMHTISAPFRALMHFFQPIDSLVDQMDRGNATFAFLKCFALILAALLGVMLIGLCIKGLYRLARRVISHMPGLRHVILLNDWGHITAALSHLLRAGLPLDAALGSIAASTATKGRSSLLIRMRNRVQQGDSLSLAMKSERWGIPRSLHAAVSFGEHTGTLPDTFRRMSHLYVLRARRHTQIILDVLIPAGIVCAGALVAGIGASAFSLMRVMAEVLLEGA